MICHTLQLVEGGYEASSAKPYYRIEELESRLEPKLPSSRTLIVRALYGLRASIESYMALFKRYTKRLYGFSLTLDTPPPRLIGDKLYPGYWVGVYEYYEPSGECIRIVVHPHLEKYVSMIIEIDRYLTKLNGFRPLLDVVLSGSPTLTVLDRFSKLVLEVSMLAIREPKRYTRIETSSTGTMLVPSINMGGVSFTALKTIHGLNTELVSAIAATIRSLAAVLRQLEEVVEEGKHHAKSLGYAYGFWVFAEMLVERLKNSLRTLLDDPYIMQSVSQPVISDPGKYSYLVYASRMLSRGLTVSLHGTGVRVRQFLYPSTKLYELYVYATLLKQYAIKGFTIEPSDLLEARVVRGDSLAAEVYYNHYPPHVSRLIAALVKRTPKPDMLVYNREPREASIVIDAKYRHLDSFRLRRLHLSDAVRLAAYLLDAARDEKLAAIIVALTKPEHREVASIKRRLKPINGKQIDIEFLEVNPDTGHDDLVNTISSLI